MNDVTVQVHSKAKKLRHHFANRLVKIANQNKNLCLHEMKDLLFHVLG